MTDAACSSERSFSASRSTRAVSRLCTLYRQSALVKLNGGAEYAAFSEVTHNFFSEERIALGLLNHLPGKCLRQNLDTDPILDQTANVARR
jgi:hypothetical protein